MTHVSTARIPGSTDPARIVDALVGATGDGGGGGRQGGTGGTPPLPDPSGFVIVAELRPELEATLRGIREELDRRRLFSRVLLVGIDHHRETLESMLDIYETTLIVDPRKEHLLNDLLEFLPALFDNWEALGTCGSLQLPKIDVSGINPRGPDTSIERELLQRKTPALHQLAEVDFPDFYAVTTPGDYVSLTVGALDRQARVIDVQGTNESTITVAGFVFDEIGQGLDDRLEAIQRERHPQEGGRPEPDATEDPRRDTRRGGLDRDTHSVTVREVSPE